MARRRGAESIGPVTDKALASAKPEGPPVMAQEMHQRLEKPGDFILLWGGAMKFPRGSASWSSLSTSLGEGGPDGPEGSGITTVPPSHLARMLGPFSHEARIQLLQLLWPEARASAELSEATGLKGGNLHYHLKELIYADYVEQKEGRYQLTRLGAQLLITVGCIALQNVQDRGEEGLEILGGWSEGEG